MDNSNKPDLTKCFKTQTMASPAHMTKYALLVLSLSTTALVSTVSQATQVTVISPSNPNSETAQVGNTNNRAGGQQPPANGSGANQTAVAPQQELVIDPNSLAADQLPNPERLSAANQALLTQNANLQRSINDLETQVNVLINERSGQLFLYGVFTVILSFIAGLLTAAIFMKKRNDRW